MIRRPPRSTLFPYTTLFRSRDHRPGRPVGVRALEHLLDGLLVGRALLAVAPVLVGQLPRLQRDRKSTRLNSSHANISYAVFCLKKKKNKKKYNLQIAHSSSR